MILTLTAEQTAFFSKNGFLELEGFLKPNEIAEIASLKPGRDHFRSNPIIKKLLLSRKMSNIVLALLNKDKATLGLDHKFDLDFFLKTPEKMKNLFCVQGLSLFIFFQVGATSECEGSKLGILPFCKTIGNILIVKSDLLIQWPNVHANVFLAAYSSSPMVYIDNPRDPFCESLKKLSYEYGDRLRNETHPLLQRTDHR